VQAPIINNGCRKSHPEMKGDIAGIGVRFTAFVLLGPSPEDQARVLDLLESLCVYEPNVAEIIIADDTDKGFRLSRNFSLPPRCRCSVLRNPLSKRSFTTIGLNTLMCLHYCHQSDIGEFVIKFDTDALVIAPFSTKIAEVFKSNAGVGMVGLLADSCDRAQAHFQAQADFRILLETAVKAAEQFGENSEGLERWLKSWPQARPGSSAVGLKRFAARFIPLHEANFLGEHCNGGAYAISKELLIRMERIRAFDDYGLWASFPFSEDRMVGLYRALADLGAMDFSSKGEPFGTRASGLAFSPQELCDFGYSIIHSVKNDDRYSEDEIRSFFRLRRLSFRA
jgi:hypothetical protein